MTFARYTAQYGLPAWIYYSIPAAATIFLPPITFAMNRKEILVYMILAFFSAPLIHTLFSLFLGWTEYMPFLQIPSLKELF